MDAADRPEDPARRRLFVFIAGGAAGTIAATLSAVLARFVAAPIAATASRRVRLDLGPASAFDATREGTAGPREIVLDRVVEDAYMTRRVRERVLVVRDAAAPGGLAALSPTCSHLGCGVSWSAEYAADGKVLAGPPPRPLGRLPLVVEGGRVRVDVEKLA